MSAPPHFRRTRGARYVGPLLLALGVAILASPLLVTAAPPRALVAQVERVSAGDSLVAVAETGAKLRVRLLGIDAPEVPNGKLPGQPFGEAAQAHLTRLIGGRTVRVVPYGRDGEDRILAVVFLGPTNVNLEMVTQGLAEVNRGAARQVYFRDLRVAELKARRDRVGMWAQGASRESPTAFRRRVGIPGD